MVRATIVMAMRIKEIVRGGKKDITSFRQCRSKRETDETHTDVGLCFSVRLWRVASLDGGGGGGLAELNVTEQSCVLDPCKQDGDHDDGKTA